MANIIESLVKGDKEKAPLPFYTFRIDDFISELEVDLRNAILSDQQVGHSEFWEASLEKFHRRRFHPLELYCDEGENLDSCALEIKVQHVFRTVANLPDDEQMKKWIQQFE